jgi:hypothetical protein
MTHDPQDSRAEQAFRAALTQRAEALDTVPLEAPSRSRGRRWLPGVVAAAVLALVGGTALAAGVLDNDEPGSTSGTDSDVQSVGALPPADAGSRWVSWRNVGVQVPAAWADGYEAGSDWCADRGSREPELPPAPYVSRNSSGIVFDILCPAPDDGRPDVFGESPQDHWAPHLTFAPAAEALEDGETSFDGWTITAKTIDSVQLRLWTDSETSGLADQILESVATFTTDANGCDVTSPVQAKEFVRPRPAFDVAQVDAVDSISICQYDRFLGDQAVALMQSRRLVGLAAADLLAGIQNAPTGGGPDWPEQCTDDSYGDHGIAIRFHHDGTTDDAYVYYDWCFGNGIDDGTTRFELTADNCAPLFGNGVVAWSYQSSMGGRCH